MLLEGSSTLVLWFLVPPQLTAMPAAMQLLAVAALLLSSFVSSAPDSIGQTFIYTLASKTTGSIILYAADDKTSPQCNVTSDAGASQREEQQSYTVDVSGSIQIICSSDVSAILSAGSAVSALLPVDVLGTQYISIADNLVVTATADATKFKVVPLDGGNISINGLDFNSSTSYTLNEGESCNITHSHNLIATQIIANKPVSVLNDDISLQPLNTWGNKYLLTPLSAGREYRIVGEDTKCQLDGKGVIFTESMLVTNSSGELDCDKPVEVGYFDADTPVTVMPSMVQFSNHITVYTPVTEPTYNLYVQIQSDSLVDLIINDQSADEFPNKINSTDITDKYIELHYKVDKGVYNIYHKKPTVVLYAYVMDGNDRLVSFSPLRMVNTGEFCHVNNNSVENDGTDNDCDYSVDEELLNGVDDDGDGRIDEDIATNELYGDTRDNSGKWPLSYTVLIIVLLIVVLVILIAICHWQCSLCNPPVKEMDNDLMVASYDSRAGTAPPRYRLSGSRTGFTISRG